MLFFSDHELFIFEAFVFFEDTNKFSKDGDLAAGLRGEDGWNELLNSTMVWGNNKFNASMRMFNSAFYLRNSFSIPVRKQWLGGVIICQ